MRKIFCVKFSKLKKGTVEAGDKGTGLKRLEEEEAYGGMEMPPSVVSGCPG